MSGHDPLLDRALELARRAEPRSGNDDERIIAEALVAGRARHRSKLRKGLFLAAAVGPALAAAAALVIVLRPIETPSVAPTLPDASPAEVAVAEPITTIELPTHDVLRAPATARFVVTTTEPRARAVRVERGAVLFDVARIEPGSTFEVSTPTASVRVLGTVFAVEVSAGGTAVRVFEGRVRIVTGAGEHELTAGEVWGASHATHELARLEIAGTDAARARASMGATAIARTGAIEPPSDTGVDPTPPVLTPPEAVAPMRARVPRTEAAEPEQPATEPAVQTSLGDEQEPSPELASASAAARWIARGDAQRALEAARTHTGDSAWTLVEADALRALGRLAEAADAYDRVAASASDLRAMQAAFTAASLRAGSLHDDEGALVSLALVDTTHEGSPLAERSLALRARSLARLGRRDELREVAREYVRRFPEGSRADELDAFTD